MTSVDEIIIHIHEDDWGLRNLYPISTHAKESRDLAAAAASGEQYEDPSGFGWTDVHVIEPPKTGYAEEGLLLSDAAAALEPLMPRIKHFYATAFSAIGREERDPYGAYDDDAWAFGFGPHCYLKLEVKGTYADRIWFDVGREIPQQAAILKTAMLAINRLVPSLVVDYMTEAIVPLSDTTLLDRYFRYLVGGD